MYLIFRTVYRPMPFFDSGLAIVFAEDVETIEEEKETVPGKHFTMVFQSFLT